MQKKVQEKLGETGLELDYLDTGEKRLYLDDNKINILLKRLGMFLNFDDLMEIKRQLNSLSKEGRTILERVHHMNERKKVLKLKHLKKQSLLNWWVVE